MLHIVGRLDAGRYRVTFNGEMYNISTEGLIKAGARLHCLREKIPSPWITTNTRPPLEDRKHHRA